MEDGIKVRVQRIILAIAWKIKAIKRRHQLKALNKRFDEVKESRDLWRRKAAEKQDETLKLKNEILILKKEIEILAKKKSRNWQATEKIFLWNQSDSSVGYL